MSVDVLPGSQQGIFLIRSHLQKDVFFVICCAFSRMMENITGREHLKSSGQFHGAEAKLITAYHSGHMF